MMSIALAAAVLVLVHLAERLVRARPQKPVEKRTRPALHQSLQDGFRGAFLHAGLALVEGGRGGCARALRQVLPALPRDVHGHRTQPAAAGLVRECLGQHRVAEVVVGTELELDQDGARLGGHVGPRDVDAAQGPAEQVRVFGRDVLVEGERGGGLLERERPEVADLRGEGVAAGEEGRLAECCFADWRCVNWGRVL